MRHDQDDAHGYGDLFADDDKSQDTEQFWRTMNAVFWGLMLALLVGFWILVGK